MKRLFLFVILTAALTFAQNQAPVASNLTFAQRTDGSYKVDIYYDVTDADGDTLTITIQASNDAGTTWDFAITSVTGDVGANITSGTQKHIVWDFDADHTEYYSEQIKLKIIADDEVIPCGELVVSYYGKTYNTVQIGSQCWMKENLNVGNMLYSQWTLPSNNGEIEKYCYDNNSSRCSTYGGLYSWLEAMNYSWVEGSQGICPTGWHIPALDEFQILINQVNNNGNNLKEIGQGNGEGEGNNTSGFSALLAGRLQYLPPSFGGSKFKDLNLYGQFWTSTMNESLYSDYYNYIHINAQDSNISIFHESYSNKGGKSIRCIKD